MPASPRRRLLLLLSLLSLLALPGHAQSRRLQRLWAELVQHPQAGLPRERALWALAWDKEVPPPRQDSLAAQATALAVRLRDPAGQLAGQVFAAQAQLAAGQREAARQRLQPVLAQARRLGSVWLEVLALIQLGRTYWSTPQQSQALRCWQQAWIAAQRQPDGYWRIRTALLQANAGPGYTRGLPWYYTGLRLAEQFDCQTCQADALGGLGYSYGLLGQHQRATRYAYRAVQLQRQLHNQAGECRALFELAELQVQLAQYPAALATYGRATQLAATPDDSLTLAAGLATTYAAQGRFASARAQAQQGLALAQRLGSHALTAALESTLAGMSLRQGQAGRAIYYGCRAWAHRQREAGQVDAATCQVLAQAYAARGRFAEAYAFQQRAQAYHDTLNNDYTRTQAAEARYAYELERKQRQIAQLERDQARGQLREQQLALAGLAALLLLLAAGAAAWLLRQRQRQRVVALRAQLATDLHDEVGTLLTRVSVQAELLPGLPAAQQPLAVAGLLRNSRAAASTMRDVVWGIDARADSAGSLLDRMREYLHQTVEAAGWQVDLEVNNWPDEVPLPPAVRQAVYRIFKEAVTNALRHAAGATRLHVALSRSRGQLLLILADNGQPVKAAPPASTGMGLRNMQQRAAALGGHVAAGAQPGGFRVRVQVPVPD